MDEASKVGSVAVAELRAPLFRGGTVDRRMRRQSSSIPRQGRGRGRRGSVGVGVGVIVGRALNFSDGVFEFVPHLL